MKNLINKIKQIFKNIFIFLRNKPSVEFVFPENTSCNSSKDKQDKLKSKDNTEIIKEATERSLYERTSRKCN